MLADLIGQPQFKNPTSRIHGSAPPWSRISPAVANRRIAAAEVGMFAYRRAAAKNQHRDIAVRQIDDAAGGVG